LGFILVFVLAGVVTLVAYWWFKGSVYFDDFTLWASGNVFLLSVSLVVIKIIGIIWPPLPGAVFTLASVPFLGWFLAYLLDLIGSLIGSSIAFWLGKKYGFPFLRKLFGDGLVKRIKKFKVKPRREIESVFLLRTLGGGVLLEMVSYASGLLSISYRNFLIGSILSHILIGIPIYYFVGSLLDGRNILVTVFSGIVIVLLFFKFKDRYLEKL
jgi:uncharacterized membrane protein YdjX (TVP38/TMEM64 family)